MHLIKDSQDQGHLVTFGYEDRIAIAYVLKDTIYFPLASFSFEGPADLNFKEGECLTVNNTLFICESYSAKISKKLKRCLHRIRPIILQAAGKRAQELYFAA